MTNGMKSKILMLSFLLAMAVGTALGQVINVNGVVVDENDDPILGVTVRLKSDASKGANTDPQGRFTLQAKQGELLVVSYIGYRTQEVKAAPSLRIKLQPDAELLDEVIVVAYGTAKKESFTGSAAVVDSKKLELRPITNVSKGLEGQSTGILTTAGSGQPGSSANVVIRGFGSINASATPLYVVDGIPFDGSLSSINPADIESFTILKDASAGALYGARGANGVVMITTKRGKEGKPSVSWRSTMGWNTRALEKYPLLSQKDYVQLSYESLRNNYFFDNGYTWNDAEAQARASLGEYIGGTGELYNPFKNYKWSELIDPATGQVRADAKSAWDENWFDAVVRENAPRHEHQFSVNGGTERTQYMTSLGYLKEDGILINTSFQRFNARANVNTRINDWFSSNLNVSLSHTSQNFSDYSGSSTSNVWYSAQFVSPLFPVYLRDLEGKQVMGEDGKPQLDYGEKGRPGSYTDFNPLGGLLDDKAESVSDVVGVRTGIVLGSDEESAGFLQGLKLAINFGTDYRSTNQMRYMNMHHGNQAKAGGLLTKYNMRTQSYTFNQLLTYNRNFGMHHLDLLAGHEYYDYLYRYLEAGKTNLVDGILELRPGTTLNAADSYTNVYRIESWLGRFNYDYADKYYLSASLRTDGSSRFHKDHRWGLFWSLGANWRVTQEDFMKDVTWLNNLSVKVSYGQQGNDALGTLYAWQSLYSLDWANANQIGAMISSLENKNITWEKNANLNAGFEASMFDNRLRINAEYYVKKTYDMLLAYPKASSTGFDSYNANVGNMENSGIEFELRGTPIRTNDFTWELSFMGSTVKNKVTKLTQESPEIISGIYLIREGLPINTFYMSKSAGVDPATGAQLYWVYDKDDKGNITKEYISSDRAKASESKYELGDRIPTLFGSIGTNLSWKGLELSVLTTYSLGGKIYDGLYAGAMHNMYYNANWNQHALRRWQKPGDHTDVPRIMIGDARATTDNFLIDASYFSIKNVTLGYALPKSLMKKIGLNACRLFASGDNLALFTHLKGMDPQNNFSGSTDYSYSPNRTYSVGIEINF